MLNFPHFFCTFSLRARRTAAFNYCTSGNSITKAFPLPRTNSSIAPARAKSSAMIPSRESLQRGGSENLGPAPSSSVIYSLAWFARFAVAILNDCSTGKNISTLGYTRCLRREVRLLLFNCTYTYIMTEWMLFASIHSVVRCDIVYVKLLPAGYIFAISIFSQLFYKPLFMLHYWLYCTFVSFSMSHF